MKNIKSDNDDNKNDALNASKRSLWEYPVMLIIIAYDTLIIIFTVLMGSVFLLLEEEPLFGILSYAIAIAFSYLIVQVDKGKENALLINFVVGVLLSYLTLYIMTYGSYGIFITS